MAISSSIDHCDGWNDNYRLLTEFWIQHQHCNLPTDHALSQWVDRLRLFDLFLSREQIVSLNRLGFFNPPDDLDPGELAPTDNNQPEPGDESAVEAGANSRARSAGEEHDTAQKSLAQKGVDISNTR